MAIVGYARTSTQHQDNGLEAQLARLKSEGCEKIFSEQVSSLGERTKLDRLARSVAHLVEINTLFERKGVALKILDMGIDTGCPTGRLFLNIVGSIAQFEREIMLERQRDGIEAARLAGKFKGRVPTARRQEPEIRRLAAEGLNQGEIAQRLGISLRSVQRYRRG